MDQFGEVVIFETSRHRVTGRLRLPLEGYRSRLTDYLNAPEQRFVPLTDAVVRPLDGGSEVRHAFLLLAVHEIAFARPADGEAA